MAKNPSQSGDLLSAKERPGGKAADNQRVNNCKVPLERRDNKMRPDACRLSHVLTPDREVSN